jgi:hypothetical protein
MLFGQETRPATDFLPRIRAHVEGADEEMLQVLAMDAIIQFVRDSQILSEIICVTVEPCIDSYKLHTRLRPYEVLALRIFQHGRQISFHDFPAWVERDFKTLYIDQQVCQPGMQIEVELSVVPERDSDEVPAVIYEDWVEPVVAYTLARLYRQVENQWYNNPAAEEQLRIYQEFVRKANINRVTKNKPLQMRLAARRGL